FDTETGVLARKAAESLNSQNLKGVIVDLRSDGGGYLDAAKDVAGIWLNDATVATQRNGNVVISQEKTGHSAILGDMKTVVLVDGGSASASEILAAALRDNGKATLVGEKTFGKGSVQQMIDLDAGAQLKVTIARWYTPKGINVSEKGLIPEEEVKLTQEDIDADRDPQLDGAKQVLK
ncbi:MAG: S41 family peptidase, partial [Candidatus Saccharimonadales bacterium]